MPHDEDQKEVLDKLHKLQMDCSVLNDFIERVLLSSGICKKYTHPNEPVYCNLKQRDGYFFRMPDFELLCKFCETEEKLEIDLLVWF